MKMQDDAATEIALQPPFIILYTQIGIAIKIFITEL